MTYLIIYKKGDKLYQQLADKLTTKYEKLHEDFKLVRLGYKNKIASFRMDSLQDLKKSISELIPYGFKMFVAENSFNERTDITLRIDLLNNPFYGCLLSSLKKNTKEDAKDDKCEVRMIQIENPQDYKQAEQEFNFSSSFGKDFFDIDENVVYH